MDGNLHLSPRAYAEMKRSVFITMFVCLAACARTLSVPEGTEFIRLSSQGAGYLYETTLYANDVVKRYSQDRELAPDDVNEDYFMAEVGTYDKAMRLLAAEMPNASEIDDGRCLDSGPSSAIFVSVPIAGRSSVTNGCGNKGFQELAAKIIDLLPRE